jgi:hypothetical protein
MVIQEVGTLAKNIFEKEDCIVDLSIDYNGNRTATLIVLYPYLYVENTEYSSQNIEIENFVFKATMSIKQIGNEIHLDRFLDKRGYNLKPEANMIAKNYVHSHVSNYSSNEVCLGEGCANTAWLKLSDHYFMSTKPDEDISDVVFDFFVNVNRVFHIEDDDGGPWVRISSVTDAENNGLLEDIDEEDFDNAWDEYGVDELYLENYIIENSSPKYNFCPDTVDFLLESFEVSRDILTSKRNNIIDYIYSEFITPIVEIYSFNRTISEHELHVKVYTDDLLKSLPYLSEEYYRKFLFFCCYMCNKWDENKHQDKYTYVNLIDDLEDLEDKYDQEEVEIIITSDFCHFQTRYSDTRIFRADQLHDIFDELIQSPKTNNSINDAISSLLNTSFYINEKFYKGEEPDMDDIMAEAFYIYDYTTTIYLYEQRHKISEAIINCVRLHSKRNSTITEISRYTSSFNWGASA